MDRRTALGALTALTALPAAADATPLRLLSFNILAPLWADARWYPAALDPALLAADLRRARITAFLRAEGRSRDVVCLQEVEAAEMPVLQQALGSAFVGSFAGHDPH